MPTSEPIHAPTARRIHSRRHSGQLATARLDERRAATAPITNHTAALDPMATNHRSPPPMTGIPVIGKVGRATTARTNPGTPRHAESEPTSKTADTIARTPAMAIET